MTAGRRSEGEEADELVELVAEYRVLAVRIQALPKGDPKREELWLLLGVLGRRIRLHPFD